MAPALAAIAGAVDGIGYLLLAKIFTSHMSGNTVAMTIYVASGNWRESWRHFEPIVVFFFGVICGLALTDALKRLEVARMFAVLAGAEVALLLAFVLLAHPAVQWMVVFPACAMGIQNAMLRRVGHHRVRTTFVTGMLTNTAQGLVDAVTALFRRENAPGKFHDFWFYGSIWFCFAAGGIVGAFIDLHEGSVALLAPLCALLALIVVDLLEPMTAQPLDDHQTS